MLEWKTRLHYVHITALHIFITMGITNRFGVKLPAYFLHIARETRWLTGRDGSTFVVATAGGGGDGDGDGNGSDVSCVEVCLSFVNMCIRVFMGRSRIFSSFSGSTQ